MPSSRRATSWPAASSPRSPPAAAHILDARAAIGRDFPEHFPTVYAACMEGGIDPVSQPIPIAPAEHYHMGGVWTDARGRTSLARPVGRRRSRLDRRAWRQSPGLELAARSRGLRGADRRRPWCDRQSQPSTAARWRASPRRRSLPASRPRKPVSSPSSGR